MEHTIGQSLEYVLFATRHIRREDFRAILLAILIELGFPLHKDGFEILVDAILIKLERPKMRLSGIYDEIIRKSEGCVGYSQIEQAIRTTIRIAWDRRDHKTWQYFFSEGELDRKCPSNNVFISQMAYLVELMGSCEKENVEAV